MTRLRLLAFLLTLLAPAHAFADATLLVGEPYGRFGSLSPLGHTAVYLNRVCADSPLQLRRCGPDETGVVISRYGGVAGVDWAAVPLIPWLYAVERASDVPATASASAVAALRDAYRRRHLRHLVPDREDGAIPKGHWVQLVGAAYDRRVIAFSTRTTAEQDDELIRILSTRPNRSRFNLFFANCADFARDLVNTYYPGALRSSVVADLGLTTPKSIAKSFVKFAERNPSVELTTFAIHRVPGSRPDGHGPRGVLESLLKTKKYLLPLAYVQPWIPAGCAAGYLVSGRFNFDRYAVVAYGPADLEGWARPPVAVSTD
jgi:hypothetical protein